MGGFYGHLQHPFEDLTLTFGDISTLINLICDGKLQNPKEKMDGINCFLTYNNGVRYARNKTQFEAGGVSISELVEKYTDLPKVRESFIEADKTLSKAIGLNTECQKFLKNRWLDFEIINRNNPNVIDYHDNFLVFHDVRNKNNRILPNKHIELYRLCQHYDKVETIYSDTGEVGYRITKYYFNIRVVEGQLQFLPIEPTFKTYMMQFLKNIMSEYGLANQNTIGDYYNKRYNIRSNIIYKNLENNQLEELFTRLAIKRIKNTTGFLTAKPILTNFNIKQRIENILKQDNSAEALRLAEKIKFFGGNNSISPTEGIIFTYKNKQYKLTGLFAYVNQLLGLNRYRR